MAFGCDSMTPCEICGDTILNFETKGRVCETCVLESKRTGTRNHLHYITVWTSAGSFECFIYEREFLTAIKKILDSGATCVAFNIGSNLFLARPTYAVSVTEAKPTTKHNATVWI